RSPMLRTSIAFVIVLALAGIVSSRETPALHAQTPAGSGGQGRGGGQGPAGRTPSIEDRTSGLQKLDGYFPLYWEERTGTLFLDIPRLDTALLYATGLSA